MLRLKPPCCVGACFQYQSCCGTWGTTFFFFFLISPPCTPSSVNNWVVNYLGKEYGNTGEEILLDAVGVFLEYYFWWRPIAILFVPVETSYLFPCGYHFSLRYIMYSLATSTQSTRVMNAVGFMSGFHRGVKLEDDHYEKNETKWGQSLPLCFFVSW